MIYIGLYMNKLGNRSVLF